MITMKVNLMALNIFKACYLYRNLTLSVEKLALKLCNLFYFIIRLLLPDELIA